ncbi:MAG: TonB-dependent receptor [Sphingobacteriales bacterium]|nr:TonB-dependent receptor [Sphingobacteriales bacterium]
MSLQVRAQGVTSASFFGSVTNSKGDPLPGAAVIAKHLPSGTVYGITTREDGRYNLPNVRIGGPYQITVSYLGHKTHEESDIHLSLGQNFRLNVVLAETSTTMSEVVITAVRSEIMNSDRTGAATNISEKTIAALPTLGRSLNDFVRLTPQGKSSSVAATTGNSPSFGGQDSRFNNLTIDGSIFNNSFGLAGLPGGQTNSTPISLDAVEEIQINVAPYDVRQGGFVGAGINAVTRSGSNQFEGSLFYNFRNQNLAGSKAGDVEVVKTNFDVKQYGFRLGGPLVKDKLFFFVNAEAERRSDPATSFLAFRDSTSTDPTSPNVTRVWASKLDELKAFLKSKFNYDPGAYENYNLDTWSNKALFKLNYNINKTHRVSLRYNYLRSYRDVLISNSRAVSGNRRLNKDALNFQGANYVINNDLHSVIGEVNSIFSNKMSNLLQIGFTANRDYRNSFGSLFPLVDIQQDGKTYTSFGYEPFTANNRLNTDTWQFQDNLTYYAGDHTITAGINFESFVFENTFTPSYYGQFTFASLEDFYASANGDTSIVAKEYRLGYSGLKDAALPIATTKAYMPGVYAQDEINLVQDKLKLTVGVRADIPFFGNTALKNPAVDTLKFKLADGSETSYSTDELPKASILWSPRIGFNYDPKGDRSLQIRGGTGLFSGRPAFVWISNQVGNNGLFMGELRVKDTKAYQFYPDVEAFIPENATTPSTYNLAVIDHNFKFPQLWRTNLAIDKSLPFNLVATLEGVYSKTLNNVMYINANHELSSGNFSVGGDTRPFMPGINAGSSQSKLNNINDQITENIVLINSDQGASYSITAKLERQFSKGLYLMLGYNYGQAKDLITAGSIASSSWSDNKSINNNNNPGLSYSDFDQLHRLIAAASYRFEYAKFMASQLSLFFQTGNQGRYSFYYNGDLNGDGNSNNDLLYVPKDANDIKFKDVTDKDGNVLQTAAEQATAFMTFVEGNKYLNDLKGQYTERNGAILPWLSTIDLAFQQEFGLKIKGRRHAIQIRADFYNFGNLLSSSAGVGNQVNLANPLKVAGYDKDANGNYTNPVYNFSKSAKDSEGKSIYATEAFGKRAGLDDVWQAQLGIRYIF